MFDRDGNGRIDFREFCLALVDACLGPGYDRLRFLFSLFDVSGSNRLATPELKALVTFCWRACGQNDEAALCGSEGAEPPNAWVEEQVGPCVHGSVCHVSLWRCCVFVCGRTHCEHCSAVCRFIPSPAHVDHYPHRSCGICAMGK